MTSSIGAYLGQRRRRAEAEGFERDTSENQMARVQAIEAGEQLRKLPPGERIPADVRLAHLAPQLASRQTCGGRREREIGLSVCGSVCSTCTCIIRNRCVQDQGITHGCSNLKSWHPARPSLQLAPGLGHALAKAAMEARQQGRVLGQLHECLDDLRLHLLDQCRPAAPPPWRGRRLTRLSGRPKALHDL
jgi:hypothetical protein